MYNDNKHKNNKRTKIIRNILLVLTFVLFIFFVYTFISSYRQYQNIQKRIEYIYQSINESGDDYSDILSLYNEAENYFRQFSIDFDPSHHDNYKLTLSKIEQRVDSLIRHRTVPDSIGNDYPEYLERYKKLTEDFLTLKMRVDALLEYSEELQPFTIGNNTTQRPTTQATQHTNVSTDTTSNSEDQVIVIKKKPLLRRIFDNKADSIKLSQITQVQKEKQEIIQGYSQEISTVQQNTQQKLHDLKGSYADLRQKERELLSNNIQLLNEVNAIIHNIQNSDMQFNQKMSDQEVRSLVIKTQSFKWQMTLCLSFMFVMLCLISYYQFFATYYEKKLISEKSYAAKLAEEKTDTLAEITHEIRTPINSLIGIVDILRKKEVFDQQDKLLLESAYSDLGNTSKTINDILNISRIEGQAVNLTEFSVLSLVKDIIESYQNQAEIKGLTLNYEFADDVPKYIYSDGFKLRQIITNLISNAIKYSEKGAVTCYLQFKKPSTLHIRVADQGIGMSKRTQDNIFKKYYTATDSKKLMGGVGLGLYITEKLVQNLGGKINCESRIDRGTTFLVDIPLVEKGEHSHIRTKNTTPPTPVSIEDTHLLIVDDNPLNILYMKQLLGDYSKVHTAKNGEEALTIVKSTPIDVVITDINMPVMDGHQLLASIKTNKELDGIKIIAMSSDNEQVYNKDKKDHIRFDYILIKPFDKKEANRAIYITRYGTESSPS